MMKARGWRERYGWRESKREAMYVGGGLSVMGGGQRGKRTGVGSATGHQ